MRVPLFVRLATSLLALLSASVVSADLGAKVRPVNEAAARSLSGYGAPGLAVEAIDPGGLAQSLDLKVNDVVLEVNGVRTLLENDLARAVRSVTDANLLVFSRGARKRTVSVEATSPVRAAFVVSREALDDPDSEWPKIAKATGLAVDIVAEIPSDLSKYSCLMLSKGGASRPGSSATIERYLRAGKGVVLIGSEPVWLAGGTYDPDDDYQWGLSNISSWLGFSKLVVSRGFLINRDTTTLTQNKPLNSELPKGEKLFSYNGRGNYLGVSPSGMSETAIQMATWASFDDNDSKTCSMVYQRYGEGRVFWTFAASHPNYPRLQELLVAGILWAAGGGKPAGAHPSVKSNRLIPGSSVIVAQ